MMIALVRGRTRYPASRLAGYAYQWSARLVNPHLRLVRRLRRAALQWPSAAARSCWEWRPPLLLSEFNVDNPSSQLVLTVAIIFDAAAGRDQPHQHPGRGAGFNNVAVFTEIIGTVPVRRAAVRPCGACTPSRPSTGPASCSNTTSVYHNPTWYAIAAGRPARRVHPWSGSSSPPTCPRTRVQPGCASVPPRRAVGRWAARWSWA